MKKTIVLNLTLDLNYNEIKNYLLNVNEILRTDLNYIMCPSYLYIPYFKGKYNFSLGTQNLNNEPLTGEVTAKSLKSLNVKYTILGHHDRINNLKETPKEINNKIKTALKNCLSPIVVIGETYENYQLKKTGEVIGKQIKDYFQGVEVDKDIVLVYSPNWSFQKKQIPSKEYVIEVIELIKNIINRKYHKNIKVLYGGNVTLDIIPLINKIPNIDGLLIEKENTSLQNLKQILDTLE